jgi:hypothetical protein
MFLRSTAMRVTVAGLSALAIAATASPALAGAAKPSQPATGSLQSHGAAVTLVNGAEQTFSGSEKYSYDATFIYYSVVAVRSEGGKPSLNLYADEANDTLLAKSNEKAKKTEFVVVDSNHAPVPSTYYPTAKSKGGESTIELDNDAVILFDDTPTAVTMTADDVVIAHDVFLDAGVEYKLSVSGGGDSALFLMQSDAADPDSYYMSRRDAVASADKKGAGKPETITVTGTGDWYGLILINNSGGGTYTLTKSLA